MKLSDLKKKSSSFIVKIGKKKVKLKLRAFTLKDQVWISENFGREEFTVSMGMSDPKVITQVIWNQLDNDSKQKIIKFPVKFEEIDEQTGEKIEVEPTGSERLLEFLDQKSIMDGLDAFAESNGINQAVIEGVLSDSKKKNEETDWGEIFDLIACEYGYTYEQIFGMTGRQIQLAIENITIRSHNDYAGKAVLHGHKLERITKASIAENALKPVELAEEELGALERHRAAHLEKIK